jgi:hypothetical protein
MPYCTIEEAWTQSLNPEHQEKKTETINYEPNYNSDLFELNTKPEKNVSRVSHKSRTYEPLKGTHSKNKRFKRKIKKVEIDDTAESNNSLEDTNSFDLSHPQNEFNLQAYNEYHSKSKDLDSNVSVMEDFQENMPHPIKNNTADSNNFLEIINELRSENKRLTETIESLRNNNSSSKDNFMEVTMFIITGIIIILMMENINKLARKF